jgi:hypothetical protein
MAENTDRIPNQFHFVWDDTFFPYTAYLAIRSAAVHCKPERIFLYKTPELDGVPNFERTRREVRCLEPVNIDLPAWLDQSALPCKQQLLDANRFLKERNFHAAVADLLRALNLYLRGGIYLDTDTLTLRDMAPLRQHGGFLAEEHILVSSAVWKRNSRWRYFRTAPLTLARGLCSRFTHGVRLFQAIAPLYVHVVHNAVMGFRPRHPLMHDALVRIAERYPDRLKRYSALGPDALQDLLTENRYDDAAVLPPRCFSPLGPTMTFQYFRRHHKRMLPALHRWIVKPDTYAIHWCSHGTMAKSVPRTDEDIRRSVDNQLFARLAMAAAFPDGMPDAE